MREVEARPYAAVRVVLGSKGGVGFKGAAVLPHAGMAVEGAFKEVSAQPEGCHQGYQVRWQGVLVFVSNVALLCIRPYTAAAGGRPPLQIVQALYVLGQRVRIALGGRPVSARGSSPRRHPSGPPLVLARVRGALRVGPSRSEGGQSRSCGIRLVGGPCQPPGPCVAGTEFGIFPNGLAQGRSPPVGFIGWVLPSSGHRYEGFLWGFVLLPSFEFCNCRLPGRVQEDSIFCWVPRVLPFGPQPVFLWWAPNVRAGGDACRAQPSGGVGGGALAEAVGMVRQQRGAWPVCSLFIPLHISHVAVALIRSQAATCARMTGVVEWRWYPHAANQLRAHVWIRCGFHWVWSWACLPCCPVRVRLVACGPVSRHPLMPARELCVL